MKEQQLQESVAEYLNMLTNQRLIYWWHTPNDTYTTHFSQKAKQKKAGAVSGIPDCLILCNGKLIGIELKRPKTPTQAKGRLTDNQKIVHKRMTEHGADVFVAYNLDEVIEIVTKYIKGKEPCPNNIIVSLNQEYAKQFKGDK